MKKRKACRNALKCPYNQYPPFINLSSDGIIESQPIGDHFSASVIRCFVVVVVVVVVVVLFSVRTLTGHS